MGVLKNLRVDTFPNPVHHFVFCRQYGMAGGERVPPVPLGWYIVKLHSDLRILTQLQLVGVGVDFVFPLEGRKEGRITPT